MIWFLRRKNGRPWGYEVSAKFQAIDRDALSQRAAQMLPQGEKENHFNLLWFWKDCPEWRSWFEPNACTRPFLAGVELERSGYTMILKNQAQSSHVNSCEYVSDQRRWQNCVPPCMKFSPTHRSLLMICYSQPWKTDLTLDDFELRGHPGLR